MKTGINVSLPGSPILPLSDIFDCAELGSEGLTQRSSCIYTELPDHLQGINVSLVNKHAELARMGQFPLQPASALNSCPPLPVKFRGIDCHQEIHGH